MRHFLIVCLRNKTAALAALLLALFAHNADAALTTPKYVQGNYAVPMTPQKTVTVPYTAAQTAGNLNVVIVGWNDSAAHVTSLKDSKGNAYLLAVGPMVTGTISQSIYYAKNIPAAAAAANAVTVTFSASASYPDIRILEYSGIDPVNPVDGFLGAAGNGATSSSGTLKTANATDMLVGANTVQTSTSGAGSGFTKRLLTSPDGDIAEDEVVTAAGSYSASAPLSPAGGWVMQMVAFRAAALPTPTPTTTPKPKPTPTPTPTAISYIQGNYSAGATSQSTITVPYAGAQTAGNLNVVIVGWNDSTAHVASLKDSKGNVYQSAIGPTLMTGFLSQSIYYAKNISAAAAATNSVTVTFNVAAAYPDIRILEYSGIDRITPIDVSKGATGNSATSSSGAVTTKNNKDLLIGANTVQTSTTGPGSGFTKRLLTSPNGDSAEDAIVTGAGSYGASAPLNPAGAWVMQMVAFRAATSTSSSTSTSTPTPTSAPTPKPTATPTPKPTPTPTPKPTPTPSAGSSATLTWNADLPTSNPATNTVGYRLHLGTVSRNYTQTSALGKTTTATISNLKSGSTYYCVVTAYNANGVDSAPSNEVSYKAP
jgi:uncharacterized protein YciI